MSPMFITVKLYDDTIRSYSTIEQATEHSIEINQREELHPSFTLWELQGDGKEAKFLGRLEREFGDNKLFWNQDGLVGYE